MTQPYLRKRFLRPTALGNKKKKEEKGRFLRLISADFLDLKSVFKGNGFTLLVLFVDHCTGIAEVMGSAAVQAWIFYSSPIKLYFNYCSSSVHSCDDHLHLHSSIRSSNAV